MKKIFDKYYNLDLRYLLKMQGYPITRLSQYKYGYTVPRPNLLCIIAKCIAVTHELNFEDVLFEILENIAKTDMIRVL